jgi:hypothetical protein
VRGIYALSVALAVFFLLVLLMASAFSTFRTVHAMVSSYYSAQKKAYLRHDIEYTFRQALYYANECYVDSGFSDPSCYARYLSLWSSAWAREGVTIALSSVVPRIDGNYLVAETNAPIMYTGAAEGRIPAGYGVSTWIGG